MVATPNVLAINPTFPAKDMAGFLKELRAKPVANTTTPSSGTGGVGHLQMELFKSLTKNLMWFTFPMQARVPALRDTVGGQVSHYF
jgi:tripartite-type tricarboxylate transporter receptor subunit TctC